jgi:hypothetical protein
MKKQWITGIIISMLLLTGASAIVYAKDPLYRYQTLSIQATNTNNVVKIDTTLPLSNDTTQVKYRGIWGYKESNETCGYLGGILVKRGHVVVLKGQWNNTDNMSKGNIIVGILKRGYFNGRIITQNQTKCCIVGLYRYDAENNLLHLRWMTAQQTGWAHCHILVN